MDRTANTEIPHENQNETGGPAPSAQARSAAMPDLRRSEAARRAWETKRGRGILPFDGYQSKGGQAVARSNPPAVCPCCGLAGDVFGSRMAWLAHRSGITQTERMGRAAMARHLQRIAQAKTWRRLSNGYRLRHGLPLISGDDRHPDGIH